MKVSWRVIVVKVRTGETKEWTFLRSFYGSIERAVRSLLHFVGERVGAGRNIIYYPQGRGDASGLDRDPVVRTGLLLPNMTALLHFWSHLFLIKLDDTQKSQILKPYRES